MAICITIWSVMTALCGLAAPITIGGIVIGLLEPAGLPGGRGHRRGRLHAAGQLADRRLSATRRSTTLGYYAIGVTLGTVLANLIGGRSPTPSAPARRLLRGRPAGRAAAAGHGADRAQRARTPTRPARYAQAGHLHAPP
jgi:hypothetical protein